LFYVIDIQLDRLVEIKRSEFL